MPVSAVTETANNDPERADGLHNVTGGVGSAIGRKRRAIAPKSWRTSMAEARDGFRSGMPDELDLEEFPDQAARFRIQRAQALVLELPFPEKLEQDQLAVAIDEHLGRSLLVAEVLGQPAQGMDQGQVLSLIVGDPVAIFLSLVPDDLALAGNLVTAIPLAGVSQRSTIEDDLE